MHDHSLPTTTPQLPYGLLQQPIFFMVAIFCKCCIIGPLVAVLREYHY